MPAIQCPITDCHYSTPEDSDTAAAVVLLQLHGKEHDLKASSKPAKDGSDCSGPIKSPVIPDVPGAASSIGVNEYEDLPICEGTASHRHQTSPTEMPQEPQSSPTQRHQKPQTSPTEMPQEPQSSSTERHQKPQSSFHLQPDNVHSASSGTVLPKKHVPQWNKKSFNVLLLGKSGHGKTRTAASLLGKHKLQQYNLDGNTVSNNAFLHNASDHTSRQESSENAAGFDAVMSTDFEKNMTHPTQKTIYAGSFTANNTTVKVIDSPGLFDTSIMDEVEAAGKTIQNISEAFSLSEMNGEGINAFVIVFKYGSRYTEEEQTVIKYLNLFFNNQTYDAQSLQHQEHRSPGRQDEESQSELLEHKDSFTRKHFVLIFTNGDDYPYTTGNADFTEWLSCQSGEMKELVKSCNDRVVLFENIRGTKESYQKQRNKLIDILTGMNEKVDRDVFEDIKKNGVHIVKEMAKNACRKSTFRRSNAELHSQFQAAQNIHDKQKRERELSEISEKKDKLWREADREDRMELENERKEIIGVIDEIQTREFRESIRKMFRSCDIL